MKNNIKYYVSSFFAGMLLSLFLQNSTYIGKGKNYHCHEIGCKEMDKENCIKICHEHGAESVLIEELDDMIIIHNAYEF